MATQVSPGIEVQEIDLSQTVPAVSSSDCGIGGVFRWGPVDKVLLITSEDNLRARYGGPTNLNPETWFSAANFLAYSNQLYVSRAANTTNTVFSAIANTGTANVALHTIKNEDHYETAKDSFQANVQFIAKYPGDIANGLKISVCANEEQFKSEVDLAAFEGNTSFGSANTEFKIEVGSNVATVTLANTTSLAANTPLPYANTVAAAFNVGDKITVGDNIIGRQVMRIASVGAVNVVNTSGSNTGVATFDITFSDTYRQYQEYTSNTVTREWEYASSVDQAPGISTFMASQGNPGIADEIHIAVVDERGKFSGNPGTILEVYQALSRATDAKTLDGEGNYYKDVINTISPYIWAASDIDNAASNTAIDLTAASGAHPYTNTFDSGTEGPDESNVPIGDLANAYNKFKEVENIDISLLIAGKARGGNTFSNWLIDNIVEYRKDCIVFISPEKEDVVNNTIDPAQDVVDFFNGIRSSSYAVFDCGYKYQYDRYNNVFRWIRLNADIAGLCVNTDTLRDPWFSPAGLNRGFIKNLVKLAFNPNKAERDLLYKNRVNPVATFAGQGTVLYGDKTGLAKSSAFDRINVRRLFIVLEKTISKAAQYSLFELNDHFTRRQFVNLVDPFLRDVKGRRGITKYKVVCDETNNTAQVIDTNRFIGDIYVAPSRSINFIRLNFIATKSDAVFEEIEGQF